MLSDAKEHTRSDRAGRFGPQRSLGRFILAQSLWIQRPGQLAQSHGARASSCDTLGGARVACEESCQYAVRLQRSARGRPQCEQQELAELIRRSTLDLFPAGPLLPSED